MSLDLGPLESLHDPGAWLRQADKVERLRKAALHALATSRNGRDLIPDARRWAEHWANHPPIRPDMQRQASAPHQSLASTEKVNETLGDLGRMAVRHHRTAAAAAGVKP